AEVWCRRRRWWLRLRGVRLLSALGAGGPAVLELFADPRAEVRAQAAEWAAQQPGEAPLERLLELLDDPRELCRFAVKDALLRRGGAAAEPIARHLARAGARPHEALEVAAGIAEPRFLPAAAAHTAAPDAEVRALAASLLGAVGGAEAVERLVALLDDEDAAVRAAATTALARLRHWPAAGPIAERLGDPAWAVRRAAGLGLRELGAPGLLLLRHALDAPDRFARDMARQVLDLPDTPAAAR
ncbi:MAG TPA: HEAT repeat domain-containing protein, partial [Thermoleophilaceae bacterium]|nr:HEAT repeat domain-containing protein [Thermoleophilaceae bacterium]